MLQFQDIPFNLLVEKLIHQRDPSVRPFFQVSVNIPPSTLQNIHIDLSDQLKLSSFTPDFHEQLHFDLGFSFSDENEFGDFSVDISFLDDIFDKSTIERMADHFNLICEQIFLQNQTEIEISRLKHLLPSEEKQIHYFNATNVNWDIKEDTCFPDLFFSIAEKYPEKTAIWKENGDFMTYKELKERVTNLGIYLQSIGVEKESLVGIYVEDSFTFTICAVSIVCCGGAYFPCDIENPPNRTKILLEDTKAKVILTESKFVSQLKKDVGLELDHIIALDTFSFVPEIPVTFKRNYSPLSLAYCLFTSGSTGKPKGVLIEHKALLNQIFALGERFEPHSPFPQEVALLVSKFTFDVHVEVIFGRLGFGGQVALIKPKGQLDFLYLAQQIHRFGVTSLDIVPSLLTEFIDYVKKFSSPTLLSSLKVISGGGEVWTSTLINNIFQMLPSVVVMNLYGPTECTVQAATHTFTKSVDPNLRLIPIGKPMPNYECHILNDAGKPVVPGCIGRLFISGVSVMRGYLNLPEKTKESLVHFGKKLFYDTGDLVKLDRNQNLVYLGRKDHQVKIRGQRVELGEIESTLRTHEKVKNVVVLKIELQPGQFSLCAYILKDNPKVDETKLEKELLELCTLQLLPFMVPSYFVLMNEFPLNQSFKIDRFSLPRPEIKHTEIIKPTSPIEQFLANLWQKVLSIPLSDISTTDNFFTLGGNSLIATKLVSLIQREYSFFTISHIFTYQTIQESAVFLANQAPSIQNTIAKKGLASGPASNAQIRIFLDSQISPNPTIYNVLATFKLNGLIDEHKLKEALLEVVRRHEVLRTVFREDIHHGVAQTVLPWEEVPQKFIFEIKKLENLDDLTKVKPLITGIISLPFDLTKDILFRGYLIRTAKPNQNALVIIQHHIVSDHGGDFLLPEEIASFYVGKTLPPLPIQYLDYAIHERQETKHFNEGVEYWKNKLAGCANRILALPVDRPRSPNRTAFQTGLIPFYMSREVITGIRTYMKKTTTTLFVNLQAVLNILLYQYTQERDILVGTVVANRTYAETEQLLGFFVNTVVMKTSLDPNQNYSHLTEHIKKCTMEMLEYQDIPFNVLVEKLVATRDSSVRPFFQVLINVPPSSEDRVHVQVEQGLDITPYDVDLYEEEHFDLSFAFSDEHEFDNFHVYISYAADIFDASTIQRMGQHFVKLCETLFVQKTESPIKDIPRLLPQEIQMLKNLETKLDLNIEPGQCVLDLFSIMVEKNPDAICILDEGFSLTYAKFKEEIMKVATALQEWGVQPDEIVALVVDNPWYTMLGALGILFAGGAYCPIDIESPENRQRYQIEDANCRIVVAESRLKEQFEKMNVKLFPVDLTHKTSSVWKKQYSPSATAYCLYTSGSTGKPKGVKIEHRALTNFSIGVNNTFWNNAPEHVAIQISRWTFDVHIQNIFPMLISGGKIVLIRQKDVLDFEKLTHLIESFKATNFFIVPSLMTEYLSWLEKNKNQLLPRIKSLLSLQIGGEKLSNPLINKTLELIPSCQVVNFYGPTECTVGSVTKNFTQPLPPEVTQIPIGKPLPNYGCHVLDSEGYDVIPGCTGKLFISGPSLMREYVNLPEKTSSVLVRFPHQQNKLMYDTGDLARMNSEGDIVYLGRIDTQVKIRGQRLELGEIEAIMQEEKDVKNAVVKAVELAKDTPLVLVAYILKEEGVDAIELRNRVKKRCEDELLKYMVPSFYLVMDKFPLNSNDKVDRSQLPLPEVDSEETTEPENELERQLRTLWSSVLSFPESKISTTVSFFDLGGNSLLATKLLSLIKTQINKETTILDLLFRLQKIRKFAEFSAKVSQGKENSIKKLNRTSGPASDAQTRLFLDSQIAANQTLYNAPIC